MKIICIVFMLITLLSAQAQANCAIEKKGEYDVLLQELRDLDADLAIEARKAYGIVSGYEAFEKDAPRCAYIDKLLREMKEMIDILK